MLAMEPRNNEYRTIPVRKTSIFTDDSDVDDDDDDDGKTRQDDRLGNISLRNWRLVILKKQME